MCLGIPGKIIELYEKTGLHMAHIDFGGVVREACVDFLPEAKVGDYTIIHAGFALNLLDENDALETLEALREIGSLAAEMDIMEQSGSGRESGE
jgi:hydrogenase expression/formation protein HypC